MVDPVNARKLVGNICLHQDLVPERFFLPRNLRHVLDSHERVRQLALLPPHARSHEDMIANHRGMAGWDFPTREMLEDLMKGQNPVLRLDALQMRHPRSPARLRRQVRNSTDSDGEEGLGWLPDPETEMKVPCRVGISVVDARSSRNRADVQSVSAFIVQEAGDERFPAFSVELKKPFLVELEKFFVVSETGTNGFRHWKRTMTAKYSLEVTIQCDDSDDAVELLKRMEDRSAASYSEMTPTEGVLKATWDSLPECPPNGHLLGIRRAKGHQVQQLDYKLELSMGWTRKRESPLQRYNQKLQEAEKETLQLPTPTASDDLEKQPRKTVVRYNFKEGMTTKTTCVDGFFCPFCINGREHPSFERLQLHLMTFHDHFTFQEGESPPNEGSSFVQRNLWMSLADHETSYHRKVEDGPDTIWMNYVAPSRPLNVGAFVSGEERWGRPGRSRGTGKRKNAREKDKDYIAAPTPQPVRKRPAPQDVEDLPEHRPKKRVVPNVPGVSFYHTLSKQVLEPGEYVEESDEYVDDSWLLQSQNKRLEELGNTGAARDFTNAFSAHLAREQSGSSKLTREMLVRFARTYRERLLDVEWQRHFRAKLNQLRKIGIIGDETVSYCVRKARAVEMESESGPGADASEDDDPPVSFARVNGLSDAGLIQRSRKRWEGNRLISRDGTGSSKGKAPMVNGGSDGDTAMTDAPSVNGEASRAAGKSVCTCGVSASQTRRSIVCAHPHCVRKDFHLACVGLDHRAKEWRCAECVA